MVDNLYVLGTASSLSLSMNYPHNYSVVVIFANRLMFPTPPNNLYLHKDAMSYVFLHLNMLFTLPQIFFSHFST